MSEDVPETMLGGCQCGRVRYQAVAENDDAYLCHCRMCQRATGGVSIAFKNLPKDAVSWEREPDYYASSAIGRRGFCSVCGTPLSFDYPDSANLDLTVGSFDTPGRFVPKHHFGAESLYPDWIDSAALPRYRCDEYQALNDRWIKAIGKLPD